MSQAAFAGGNTFRQNRMSWNPARGSYEASVLLKQGWYNYEYSFLPSGSSVPEGFHFEGESLGRRRMITLVLTYFVILPRGLIG
ncbi:MAG: hypothetical protein R2756_08840 [Bacteroidales bacterium]